MSRWIDLLDGSLKIMSSTTEKNVRRIDTYSILLYECVCVFVLLRYSIRGFGTHSYSNTCTHRYSCIAIQTDSRGTVSILVSLRMEYSYTYSSLLRRRS